MAQLKFRGVSYTYHPVSLKHESLTEIGKYRGVKCFRKLYDPHQLTQSSHQLTYRGVEYRSGQGQSEPVPTTDQWVEARPASQPSISHRVPIKSSRHQKLSELDKIHNTYLLQKLEQRLTSAKTLGNQELIQILEKEKTELV